MRFIYRGVAYDASIAAAPAVETGETGTFLGKCYPMKQPQIAFRQPSEELIYRGVRYSR